MLFVAFMRWWYGAGWINTLDQSRAQLSAFTRNFSVVILLKTLFAPWKQLDAFSVQGRGFDARLRAWLDKSISRFIGFLVRSLTLWAALFGLLILLLYRLAWIIFWPCLPLTLPILLGLGLGVFS
jgi:hypothetical protein